MGAIQRLLSRLGGGGGTRQRIVEKASREAEAGRRLAMFDRETGLLASWYLERRFDEEARRSERYGRPVSVLVAEITGGRPRLSDDSLSMWLGQNVRGCDFAGHLGDGRYLVVMPETGSAEAENLVRRLKNGFPRARTGLASFPDDGADYSAVRDAAEARLHGLAA